MSGADLDDDIAAALEKGERSIQGLASDLGSDLADVRAAVFAMAGKGRVERCGRDRLNAPTWRLPGRAAKVARVMCEPVVVKVAAPVADAAMDVVTAPAAPRAPEASVMFSPYRARPRARRVGRGPVEEVKRLGPVTPAKRRYAGWFLAADWPLDEVAALFDVSPPALAEAFQRGG